MWEDQSQVTSLQVYRWQIVSDGFSCVSVLVKVEVIVKCDADVFKAVNNLNRVMVDGYGVLG